MTKLFLLIFFLIVGCTDKKPHFCDDVLEVDLNDDYSKKDLVLQDLMDVEYIPLETADDFVCEGRVLDIGKNLILVGNEKFDGEVFVFDRNGNFRNKFNNRGQGDREYVLMTNALLDEENEEILINDPATRKIVVYSLEGEYKRTLGIGVECSVVDIFNFDKDKIICEVALSPESNHRVKAMVISKENGAVHKKIDLFCDKIIPTRIDKGQMRYFYKYVSILSYQDFWLMPAASSDTIFKVLEGNVSPFIVKTPSVQDSKPEKFLFPRLLTSQFYFFEKVEKKDNFLKENLVYSVADNALYSYNIYNEDIKDDVPLNLQECNTKDAEVGYWYSMDAYRLIKLKNEKKLHGKLELVTEGLDENSNPVIVLMRDKAFEASFHTSLISH